MFASRTSFGVCSKCAHTVIDTLTRECPTHQAVVRGQQSSPAVYHGRKDYLTNQPRQKVCCGVVTVAVTVFKWRRTHPFTPNTHSPSQTTFEYFRSMSPRESSIDLLKSPLLLDEDEGVDEENIEEEKKGEEEEEANPLTFSNSDFAPRPIVCATSWTFSLEKTTMSRQNIHVEPDSEQVELANNTWNRQDGVPVVASVSSSLESIPSTRAGVH